MKTKLSRGFILRNLITTLTQQAYNAVPPVKTHIAPLIKDHGIQKNDHMAFRSLASSLEPSQAFNGIMPIAKILVKLGYRPSKKLYKLPDNVRATHLEPPKNDNPALKDLFLPKIFLSQYDISNIEAAEREIFHENITLTEDIAETFAKLDQDYLTTNREVDQTFFELTKLVFAPIYQPISYDILMEINKFSQYAAWTALFGYHINHATLRVDLIDVENPQNPFNDIDHLITELEKNGVEMKDGGIVGPNHLRQTATKSHPGDATIFYREGKNFKIQWPKCYYEFAQRGSLDGKTFEDFLEANTPDLLRNTSHSNKWQNRQKNEETLEKTR